MTQPEDETIGTLETVHTFDEGPMVPGTQQCDLGVRIARAEGRQPVRVSLVRRWADSNAPGPGPARGPWHEFTFYVETVGATG